MQIDCQACPLRRFELFKPFGEEEVASMREFKIDEITVPSGATILNEGEGSDYLYTVLEGMGLRFKLMPDGGRQVLNFVYPGDFLGLQASVMGEMKHSVITSTSMRLCVFRRSELLKLFRKHPERGYDVTWLSAVEEHFLGEALANVGQSPALTRVCWGLGKLFRRGRAVGLGSEDEVPLPFRQRDLADALGLSLVHTNKTLTHLRAINIASWRAGRLRLKDQKALFDLAQIDVPQVELRPLL